MRQFQPEEEEYGLSDHKETAFQENVLGKTKKRLTLTFKIYRSAMFAVMQSGLGYIQLAKHRANIKARSWGEKT